MSEATVINLATGETVTQIKQKDEWCKSRCENILVDMHLRKLTCRECGADVEPLQWVYRMALDESHLMSRIHQLKTVADVTNKRVEDLKEEEKRIKARIRGAKESLLKSAGI